MVPDTPARCSIVVENKPSALEQFCQPLLDKLRENKYSEDDIFGVHLAVEEAFHNAVEHGNQRDPNKTVGVEYYVDSHKVEIQLTDEGCGFNPDDVPDPRVGDNLYRPNGRGLLLINAYMDSVQYNECGNRVTMMRYRIRPKDTGQEA